MRIAYQPIIHSAYGIHFEPVQDGPYQARLSIGHSNSIRLDQFRKNSWCSVGIDGYREAFVRPAWISMLSGGLFPILPYAGEIAPVPQLVAEQGRFRRTVHGNRSCIGLVDGPPVGRQVGWYLGSLRRLESLQHFVPLEHNRGPHSSSSQRLFYGFRKFFPKNCGTGPTYQYDTGDDEKPNKTLSARIR